MQHNSDHVNFVMQQLSEEKEKNRNLRIRLTNAESEIEALKLELQTKELETEAKMSARMAEEIDQIRNAEKLRGNSNHKFDHYDEAPLKPHRHSPDHSRTRPHSSFTDDPIFSERIEPHSNSPYHQQETTPSLHHPTEALNDRPYSPMRIPENFVSPTRSPPSQDPPRIVVVPTKDYSSSPNSKENKFTGRALSKMPPSSDDPIEKLTAERDKAMFMYHRLMKDFETVQSEATPESLQDRIRSLAEERDDALQAMRNLEDELQTLRVYYSLHKSLAPSMQSGGSDLPRGGLLVEQLRTALSQRDELANKYTIAQENLEKQTRLVNVLRKKQSMDDSEFYSREY